MDLAPGGEEPGGAEPGGAEPGGEEPGGAEPGSTEPGGAEPQSPESRGSESGGPEPEGPAPGGALSSEQLREWYFQYCSLRRGTSGAKRTTGTGASASPPSLELPSSERIREWYERRCTLRSGAPGVADPAAAGGATGAGDSTGSAGAAAPAVGAVSGAVDPGVGATSGAADPSAGAAAGAEDPGVGAAAGTADPGVGASVGAEDPGAGAAAGAVESGVGAAAGAEDPGVSAGSGVAARQRPYFVPLLQQVLGLPPSLGPPPPLECSQPVQSRLQLQPASTLPAPSPYTGPTGGLAERREPASRPVSPVRPACTSGCGSRQRPPPVPGTHRMSLRPSTAPLRAPLPSPPESSLPALPDPESDSLRAASPTVTRLLATVVTDPSFESIAASALVAELVDFAARSRLDYATSLVAESESVCPPSVGGECALGTDVLEDRQEEFQCLAAASPHLVSVLLTPEGDPDALDIPTPHSYAEAIEGPYSSQWQAAMDAEMASWKSTGTYVDAVPPPGANIVSGTWIFRVKRPPGSPPVFKARYVARGFSQRQGVDYFQTFSPTPKMTTLRVLLHVAAHRDYELHSLDFSTAFLQGSLHEEIWLRRPLGFTGSFPPGTQWSLLRPVYGLRQAPREWHDTLRTTLAALGFAPSTADPSLFLRTDTSLLPFYILVYVDDLVFATADTAGLAHVKSELQKRHTCTDLGELRSYLGLQITRDRARRTITLTQSHMVQQVLQRFGFTYSSPQATPLPTRHSLSALPSDESVESGGPYPELVGCLMYLMTCTRPDLAYPLSILARYVAPGRHRQEHMAAAKRVLRYLCSTSGMGLVLGGRSLVVLTGHADASWADDQATQRSSQGYTFSLGSGSVSWRATRSSSVLSSSCEAEIYAGAMAAQELRWLTYLLTDLGEQPRSPPVLTKHIALRYFLARELQQRGQLRLAYVASEANTAYVFTKALAPCDHQRFCTQLVLRERFSQDLPVLRLHPDGGGEFSSDLLRDFCRGEGILQSFTLPEPPHQNGIAEHRIGLVMKVARNSMIHAAAPHFLWPFAVRYAAHQLNLWPHIFLPETSPTVRWTGKVGDVSVFRVWGSCAFFRDTSADKLSARAIPCVPAPSGVSQVDPFPSTAPVEVAVGSGTARGAASGGAASGGAKPGGAEFEGAGSGGTEPRGAEPGGAEPAGVEPAGADLEGVEPGGADSEGAESRASLPAVAARVVCSANPPLSGAAGAGDSAAGDTGVGCAGVTAGVGGTGGAAVADPTELGAAGAGGAGAVGAGAGGTVAGGTGAGAAGAADSGTGGAGGTPLILLASPLPIPSSYTEQTGDLTEPREPVSRPASPVCTGRRTPRPRPPPVPGTHAMALRPSSVPLRVPPPPQPESSLPPIHDFESDRVRATIPTVSRLLATIVSDPSFESTHMSGLVTELVEFAAAYRLDYTTALVAKSESASPPSVGGECSLGTDVLEDREEDFDCLAAAVPRFASMLLAPEGDPDAPDIPTPRSYEEAITGPYSAQWQADMDVEMASWKSTGTYVDAFPPSRANIVDGMWIFRVKWLPGSPTAFKARYVARGFNFLQGSLHEEIRLSHPPGFTGSFLACTQWSLWQPVYGLRQAPREWHDTLRTTLAALGFTPSTADLSLFLCTDTSLPPFYVLVYVDDLVFATADIESLTLVKLELQKRHTCTNLGELRSYLGL
ncbi:unnamed protein product [Closterium sp. NIES-54]